MPWFSSYEEMLAQAPCEVVTVATPSGMHPEQGISERGPASTSSSRSRWPSHCQPRTIWSMPATPRTCICSSSSRTGSMHVQLSAGGRQRSLRPHLHGELHGAVGPTAGVLRPGAMARDVGVRWRRVHESGSHYVDLIQWIVGPVESVMAQTATLARRIETEDSGIAVLKFRSGALGSIEVTMLTYPRNLEGSITSLARRARSRSAARPSTGSSTGRSRATTMTTSSLRCEHESAQRVRIRARSLLPQRAGRAPR